MFVMDSDECKEIEMPLGGTKSQGFCKLMVPIALKDYALF